MIRRNLKNNVLAVCCVENSIFVGMGSTLYIFEKPTYEITNIFSPFEPFPDKIYGIIKEPNNKVIVCGERCVCFYKYNLSDKTQTTQNGSSIHINYSSKIFQFSDWITAVRLFETVENMKLAILFAHNNLYIQDVSEKWQNIWCQEKCLLYGGSIFGNSINDCVIFSGTVFKEILIWKNQNVPHNGYSPILHRLCGHNGVIFSVFYNSDTNLICSTSDDRTIRLWKVTNKPPSKCREIDWDKSDVSLQTTMFGHTARVWRALIKHNMVVSIGEDSQICIWSIEGKLYNKIQGHHGAAIWCLDISEPDNIIVTSADDGSVYSWPLNSVEFSRVEFPLSCDNNIPKFVSFLKSGNIIVLKGNCYLSYFNSNNVLINTYCVPVRYHNYCLTSVSCNKTCIGLSSLDGFIMLYKEICDGNKCGLLCEDEQKIMQSKIFSMLWLDNETSLVCGTEGHMKVIRFAEKGFSVLSELILPASRERWVTAAVSYKNFVICGDRAGSIYIYRLTSNIANIQYANKQDNVTIKNPLQVFRKIHGSLGVQFCMVFNENLITLGRDGTLRYYMFSETNKEKPVEILSRKNMPMSWACKMIKVKNDYYVLGFNEVDFLVYSLCMDRTLIRISCGGGHRSWDYFFQETNFKFIYIRDKRVKFVNYALHFLVCPTIMEGFHTKEIYCLETVRLPKNAEKYLFFSGSEDCTLRISYTDSNAIKVLGVYDGHISSIRCMSVLNLKDTESESINLVFSGGGRAQLKVWIINVKFRTNTVELTNDDVTCKDVASFMLRGTDRERKVYLSNTKKAYDVNPETRFMDSSIVWLRNWNYALIFLACSDGYLRILSYNFISHTILLERSLSYGYHCILKTHTFIHQNTIVILTMATDGTVNFWNINITTEGTVLIKDVNKPFYSLQVHQSGINSYDFKKCGDDEYLLVTGGDDNLLSLLLFKLNMTANKSYDVNITLQWNTSSAHSTQITGVRLLHNNRLISVGVDQRVILHTYSSFKKELSTMKQTITSISDAQGMTLCLDDEFSKEVLCIYGCGVELIINKTGMISS